MDLWYFQAFSFGNIYSHIIYLLHFYSAVSPGSSGSLLQFSSPSFYLYNNHVIGSSFCPLPFSINLPLALPVSVLPIFPHSPFPSFSNYWSDNLSFFLLIALQGKAATGLGSCSMPDMAFLSLSQAWLHSKPWEYLGDASGPERLLATSAARPTEVPE